MRDNFLSFSQELQREIKAWGERNQDVMRLLNHTSTGISMTTPSEKLILNINFRYESGWIEHFIFSARRLKECTTSICIFCMRCLSISDYSLISYDDFRTKVPSIAELILHLE